MASRSASRSQKAIAELKEQTGKEAVFLPLDSGNLASVRNAAEEFMSKETKLHVLINNAGLMIPPIDQVTVDGYNLQFGTNTLGHFFFTSLLLPVLLSTAKQAPGEVRVVSVSSMAHIGIKGIKWDTLKDTPARRKLSPDALYGQSKLGVILFSKELARRYGNEGMVSISLHPGGLKTELYRSAPGWQDFLANKPLYDASFGPLTPLYGATMPEAAKLNGEYLIPWARVGKSSKTAEDPGLAAELWEWLEEQLKGH